MKLEQRVELLHRSSQRLMDALEGLEKPEALTTREGKIAWSLFIRREIWIHLKLTIKTWWEIIWWGLNR